MTQQDDLSQIGSDNAVSLIIMADSFMASGVWNWYYLYHEYVEGDQLDYPKSAEEETWPITIHCIAH